MHKNFIDELPNYYTETFKSQHIVIAKHHRKYTNDRYAPAWKTLEFMSLGSIFQIFKALKNQALKQEIANAYGIRNVKIFENYLRVIVYIRNICSHTGVLFDLNSYFSIKSSSVCPIQSDKRNSLQAIITIVHYFLKIISDNRAQEMKEEIDKLFLKHIDNEYIVEIIREKMKFSLVY